MTRTDSMELRSFVRERDMLGYNVVGGYPAWTMSTTYRVVLLYVCTMYPGVVHGCFWRIAEATYAGRSRLVRSICSGELIERIIIKIKNKIKNTFVNRWIILADHRIFDFGYFFRGGEERLFAGKEMGVSEPAQYALWDPEWKRKRSCSSSSDQWWPPRGWSAPPG